MVYSVQCFTWNVGLVCLLSILVSRGSCAKLFSCYANYVSMVYVLRYLVREVVVMLRCLAQC